MEDLREVLGKGIHYSCNFEPTWYTLQELIERVIYNNNISNDHNYTFGLTTIFTTLQPLLGTKSWYCNKPIGVIIDPNIIVMANSTHCSWTKKILPNLRKIGPEMTYMRVWEENNGFIDNTMLPFLICKQVIPSPNLVLKAPLDFGYDNVYFIKGKEPDYKEAWSI